MRNYIEIVDDILERLTNNGFVKEHESLEQKFRVHSFQFEILADTMGHLFDLERDNKKLKTLIDDLMVELIAYCKYIGLKLNR
jgi:hypothetical protein